MFRCFKYEGADLYASEGILDEAEIDYYAAIENAVAIRQDTYAVFQLASMLELEDKMTKS